MGSRTSAPPTIGERIRQLRSQRKPSMTQREVAERAGVSVDLISKLEQGIKQSALLVTLHKIARALDVDVAVLLSGPERIDVDEDADERGMLAIRQAITALWDDAEPASVQDLTRSARYAWQCYWTNRFDTLGGLLPSFITAARATSHASGGGDDANAALSDAYGVAASMLVHLGHIDLAYLAMDRAIDAAARSGDELRHAAISGWMSWLLLHLTGTADGVHDGARTGRTPLAQARRLAVEQADRVEPKLGTATPEQISVWGRLLIDAAVAAARDGKADEADGILNLADAAATRLEGLGSAVRLDYQSPFGQPLVVMQQVDVSVVTDRPGRALKLAEQMPPDADLPTASKARHLADVAYAQTSLGRDRAATDSLLTIERMAPNWMRYQVYPRMIVRELLERERPARTPRLRALAARLNVA